MRKCISLCLVFVLLGSVAGAGPAEPRYQGKPAAFWIGQLKRADAAERQAAALALGELGAEEVPGATAALLEALQDPEANVRTVVVGALTKIAPKDKAVVPALGRMVQDKEPAVRQQALAVLGQVAMTEPAAIMPLIQALDSQELRQQAAALLGNLGSRASQATPTLRRALAEEKDGHYRLIAAQALGRIITCRRTFSSLAEYEAGFKHVDAQVRIRAITLFGQEAPKGASVAALAELLADPNVDVRRAVASTLSRRGAEAVPHLVKLLAQPTAESRRDAARALGDIGNDARAAVPALTEALKDADQQLRFRSAIALGKITKKVDVLLPILSEMLQAKNEQDQEEAFLFLEEVQPPRNLVVPALIEILIKQEAAGSAKTNGYLDLLLVNFGKDAVPALGQALQHENPKVRSRLANIVRRLRPVPKEVAPLLVQAMVGMPERQQVKQALVRMGRDAVPALLDGLKHDNATVRQEVLGVLGSVLPKDQPIPAVVLQSATDRDGAVRLAAVRVIQTFGPKADSAVPVLVGALSDAALRVEAATVLGVLGPKAQTALPALHAALKENDPAYRLTAARAVWLIEKNADVVLPVLGEMISGTDGNRAAQATNFAAEMGSAALPLLKKARTAADPASRIRAADALGRMESEAAAVAVAEALRDDAPAVRLAAMKALWTLGPRAAPAVPAVTQALKDRSAEIREAAVAVLERIGPPARPAVPVLRTMVQDGELRIPALRVLCFLASDTEEVKSDLQRLLKDPDRAVRALAAAALWKISRQPQDIVPVVREMLLTEDQNQLLAAKILVEMGPEGKDALPTLIEVLGKKRRTVGCRSPRDPVRELVVDTIRAQGGAAVPQLVAALSHENVLITFGAFDVLTRIGPDAAAAVPALRAALEDRDLSYRASAEATLRAIERQNPFKAVK